MTVLKRRRTSSVDYELPGLATDDNRGDVRDEFVRDYARADTSDAVDLVDASLAMLNDIFGRLDVGDVLQRQMNWLGLGLNRRCRDHGGGHSKKRDEKHGVGRDKTSR